MAVGPFGYHPLANLFPLIQGDEFREFCDGIREAGRLHDKIVLLDGLILDGRNRQRACDETGVTAHYRTFNPEIEGDALTFVISKNLHRRHLNESQRAACAVELATMRQGERTDIPSGTQADIEPSANLPKVSQEDAAGKMSVSPRLVRSAKKVKENAAPEVYEAVKQGKIAASAAEKLIPLAPEDQLKAISAAEPAKAIRAEVSRFNREERLDEIAERAGTASPALVAHRKYAIIYADPPWQFDVWSRETGLEKCPDQHYPTMTVEDICALPVGDLVAPDALLFLWITVPKLNRMFEIFSTWGRPLCDDPEYGIIRQPWLYVSNYNWDKVHIGPGRWNRNQHEHLLIAKIGNVPAPLPSQRVRSNFTEARGEHSAKPDYFAKLIETQFPQLPKIELFRRGAPRPGWDAWGNEAETPPLPAPLPEPSAAQASANPSSIDDSDLDVPDFLRVENRNKHYAQVRGE